MDKVTKVFPVISVCLLLLICSPVYGIESYLKLVDGQKRQQVPIELLREQADVEFTIFAPFRGREIKMRGVLLETVLERYLSKVPDKIKLIAHDGYALTFEQWKKKHWVIVTHEDGKVITIRQQGPLRLVEREYAGKDAKNLRNFNDWVWMLDTIEAM
mgnify:CR=1 FL=1